MTYNASENSTDSGSVVEMYEFVQGIQRWVFTTNDTPVEYLGREFVPTPIKRSRIKQSENVFKDGVSLTLPRENPFASQFLPFSPDQHITINIYRFHRSAPNDVKFYWKGRVAGVSVSGNSVTIDCESIFTSIKRPGLRAKYQYDCRHALYSAKCGVNRERF